MSLNRSNPSDCRWWITRRKPPLVTIGYVEAPDEDGAIERAIEKFHIAPGLAEKLIAEKTKAQPHRNR